MQNKPQPSRRSIWPVFAALLLIVIAGITVWRFWPREYSLADPRGYGAFEEIPIKEHDTSFFWNPEIDYWNFGALKLYGLLPDSKSLAYISEEEWIDWSTEYIVDFLSRVATDKSAVLRGFGIYEADDFHSKQHKGPYYYICEYQYQPQNDNTYAFQLTVNHAWREFSSLGICKFPFGALSVSNHQNRFAFIHVSYTPELDWTYETDGYSDMFLEYWFGDNAERDQEFLDAVNLLVGKGLCKLKE